MAEQTKSAQKRTKLRAVALEAMKPENAPPGYTVRVILARGGLLSTITKIEQES